MLHNTQVSTDLVRDGSQKSIHFSIVPLLLLLPLWIWLQDSIACHASRQLQHTFWSLLYSTIYFQTFHTYSPVSLLASVCSSNTSLVHAVKA